MPEPSFAGSSHTNPGPVHSGFTGHSNANNMLASGSAGRHVEWQPGDMYCRFFTIIRINLTIILIILNVCAGFCRYKSWIPRCSSTFSACLSNCKLRDRLSSLYRCRRATVSAVLKLLFLLFYYYSTIILIILAIIRIIRKTKAALQVSIHCGNRPPSFPEAAPTQEIIILMEIVLNHLPRPPFPAQWMGQFPLPLAGQHMWPWCV